MTALCAVAAVSTASNALAQEKVLRVIPATNLSVLDPIWTTAYPVRNHGYMIYDTLFGTNEQGEIKPQMVDKWSVSPDGLQWSFTLRKGLKFHDGKPVTGEDVTASLSRWSKRDNLGQLLFARVDRMDAPSPDTFRIFMKEPAPFMLEALGKPSSIVPFIMPKRIAETDAFKQITEYIGSGPYVFKADEFKPGDKAVYVKFKDYVPRDEPPSGTTGGKRVYVDRVEMNLALRDPQSQVNALINGEVDMIEQPAFQSYAALKASKDIKIDSGNLSGLQYTVRLNHTQPPFDNVKVRQAALAAMSDQEAFLKAQVGLKEYYKVCKAMFYCGTQYANEAGAEAAKKIMREAQEMLKNSGYDGTPVLVLKPTDLPCCDKLPDVAAQMLRQAGFKVELASMDWNSILSRRAKKVPVSEGGWNIFATSNGEPDVWNPMSNIPISAAGDKAWFGWPNDPELEAMRTKFSYEPDQAKRVALAEQIQARAYTIVTHVLAGEFVNPAAMRTNVTGLVHGSAPYYWNLNK